MVLNTALPTFQQLADKQTPQLKIDQTQPISFANILLTFNNEPPQPPSGPQTYSTLVYHTPHGYNYSPAFLPFFVPPLVLIGYGRNAALLSQTLNGAAWLEATADDTNINLWVQNYWDGTPSSTKASVAGLSVYLRLFVFVDSLDQ